MGRHMIKSDIEFSHCLAAMAFEGITDKAGQPLICHVERVAARCKFFEEKVVANLHDTVEEKKESLENIKFLFGSDIADAVDAITRREDESYSEYINRVKANDIARVVKINDLIDNSNLSRLETVTVDDINRTKKYLKALETLLK